MDRFGLSRVFFGDIPGWASDRCDLALEAFARCARYILEGGKPYRAGAAGPTTDDLRQAYLNAISPEAKDHPRRFFETHFSPFALASSGDAGGFVTGFYEPEVDVAGQPDAVHRYPFYRRPADLAKISPDERLAGGETGYAFARQSTGGFVAYADRCRIESGFLDGQGLEIAWAKNRIDVFFAHIQGAARLRYPDGSVRRITYAAKSGHPFTAVGRLLVEKGELSANEVTMDTIRSWLAANPARHDEILWQNRSFIFFREVDRGEDDADCDVENLYGPVAAAKVPLTPGRSLAVDRTIHTFSTPFWVDVPALADLDGGRNGFRRLMIAQDTGSAIVGQARGDIFVGSGAQAGSVAGAIRHPATMYVLLPNAFAARLAP